MSRILKHREKIAGDHEVLDPTPVELTGTRPPTLREQIQWYIADEVSRLAKEEGHPTFEEEDDFEEDDPPDAWGSPFEMKDDGDYPELDGKEVPDSPPEDAPSDKPASTEGAPSANAPNAE